MSNRSKGPYGGLGGDGWASGGYDDRGNGGAYTGDQAGGGANPTYTPSNGAGRPSTAYGQGTGGGLGLNPAGFVNWSDFLRAQPLGLPHAPQVGGVYGMAPAAKDPANPNAPQSAPLPDFTGGAAAYQPSGGYTAGMANIDAILNAANASAPKQSTQSKTDTSPAASGTPATAPAATPTTAPAATAVQKTATPQAVGVNQNMDPYMQAQQYVRPRDETQFSGLSSYFGRGM